MPVAIWSLMEGAVFSPASSHSRLPANVYADACQKSKPAERAKP